MPRTKQEKTFTVTLTATVSMTVDVAASDWKKAAKEALEIAQNDLKIDYDDINYFEIDWDRITEDMVEGES